MTRENAVGGGCVVVAIAALVLFVQAAVRPHDEPGRNALFAWAFAVALLGTLAVLAAWAVILWLDMRRTEQTQQALVERAERLRREREVRRRQEEAQLEAKLSATASQVAETDLAETPRKVISLDDVPADLTLLSPTEVTVARAATDLGICPLCQTRIVAGEEYVTCPACKARYHPDCWEYNGGCAVYGCTVRIRH